MAVLVGVSGEWGEGDDFAGGDCGMWGGSVAVMRRPMCISMGWNWWRCVTSIRAALEERANEHGVASRYSDYEEMFGRERLDVVSVCTHAPLHMRR